MPAVKNKEFWGLVKTNMPEGEAARVINLQSENKKPIRIAGDLCQCLICGYVGGMITKAHAERHEYANQRAMIEAGKAKLI